MLKKFIPNYRFKKITGINPGLFYGAQLIIFDLDNTLVFSETTNTTKEIASWFSEFKNAFLCVVVSNSRSFARRAEKVEQLFSCDAFLSKHKKPYNKLFKEIKNKYRLKSGKIFVIGDRLFTDVLFGNFNGATTILVDPLSEKESFFIKIIRVIEKLVLLWTNIKYN